MRHVAHESGLLHVVFLECPDGLAQALGALTNGLLQLRLVASQRLLGLAPCIDIHEREDQSVNSAVLVVVGRGRYRHVEVHAVTPPRTGLGLPGRPPQHDIDNAFGLCLIGKHLAHIIAPDDLGVFTAPQAHEGGVHVADAAVQLRDHNPGAGILHGRMFNAQPLLRLLAQADIADEETEVGMPRHLKPVDGHLGRKILFAVAQHIGLQQHVAFTLNRVADRLKQSLVSPREQPHGVLAQQLGTRQSGQLGDPPVHIEDRAVEVGDDGAVVEALQQGLEFGAGQRIVVRDRITDLGARTNLDGARPRTTWRGPDLVQGHVDPHGAPRLCIRRHVWPPLRMYTVRLFDLATGAPRTQGENRATRSIRGCVAPPHPAWRARSRPKQASRDAACRPLWCPSLSRPPSRAPPA